MFAIGSLICNQNDKLYVCIDDPIFTVYVSPQSEYLFWNVSLQIQVYDTHVCANFDLSVM